MFSERILTLHRKEILERLMHVYGCSKFADLACLMDITPQSVSNASRKKIPEEWVTKVSLEKGVSLVWLITGEGEVYEVDKKNKSNNDQSNYQVNGSTKSFELKKETGRKLLDNIKSFLEFISMIAMMPTTIPSESTKLNLASKSEMIKKRITSLYISMFEPYDLLPKIPVVKLKQLNSFLNENNIQNSSIEYFVKSGINTGINSFAIIIENESMMPQFYIDDIAIINKTYRIENSDFVLANANGEFIVRQYFIDDSVIFLNPLNPIYKNINTNDSRIKILGKVIQKIRTY